MGQKDRDGRTALMWAATYGRVDTVELLIRLGADLNARDSGGHTALYWAQSSKAGNRTKRAVVDLSRKAGARG